MLVSSSLLFLAACGPTRSDLYVATDPTETPLTETGLATVEAEPDLAGQIAISKISIYQGVESVLWEEGAAPTSFESPIITNRGALLRVFLEPEDGWTERKVVGHLTLRAGDEVEELTKKRKVSGPSTDGDLKSTINFELTPEQVKLRTEFSLEVREETADAPGGGKRKKVTFDSEQDLQGGLDTEQSDEVTIVIIPIRYNYDGSGRLPDTSDSHIQRIQELAQGMYPASTVNIRVDPAMNWNQRVSALSQWDWADLLDAVSDLRDGANEPPNTYYYGMFQPEDTLFSYCDRGCILGLSNLGWSTSQEWLRASIGLGYSTQNTAAETLVHEVGHAHGREHAPCGLYGQPADPAYPYAGASIGAWGYDIVSEELFNPASTVDMMSYCPDIWVSDYTYYSLWQRIAALSAQSRSAPYRVSKLRVFEDGTTVRRGTVRSRGEPQGLEVDVRLFDEQGADAGVVDGWMFPNSHFGGGVVTLDFELPEGWTAEVL